MYGQTHLKRFSVTHVPTKMSVATYSAFGLFSPNPRGCESVVLMAAAAACVVQLDATLPIAPWSTHQAQHSQAIAGIDCHEKAFEAEVRHLPRFNET